MVSDLKYYAPADEQANYWLIKFADQDVPDETYPDEESAVKRFEAANQSWTCYLFELKKKKDQQATIDKLVEALKEAESAMKYNGINSTDKFKDLINSVQDQRIKESEL